MASSEKKPGFLKKAFGVATKGAKAVLIFKGVELLYEQFSGKDLQWGIKTNNGFNIVQAVDKNQQTTVPNDPAAQAQQVAQTGAEAGNAMPSVDTTTVQQNEGVIENESDTHTAGSVSSEYVPPYVVSETPEVIENNNDVSVVEQESVVNASNVNEFVPPYVTNSSDFVQAYASPSTENDSPVNGESGQDIIQTSEDYATYIHNMAQSVIRGDYGNGQERKDALGDEYSAIQHEVNLQYGIDDGYESKIAKAESLLDTVTVDDTSLSYD